MNKEITIKIGVNENGVTWEAENLKDFDVFDLIKGLSGVMQVCIKTIRESGKMDDDEIKSIINACLFDLELKNAEN